MYRIELTPRAEEELVALGRSGDKASIKKEDRLVYCVKDAIVTVTVVQVGRHYIDK